MARKYIRLVLSTFLTLKNFRHFVFQHFVFWHFVFRHFVFRHFNLDTLSKSFYHWQREQVKCASLRIWCSKVMTRAVHKIREAPIKSKKPEIFRFQNFFWIKDINQIFKGFWQKCAKSISKQFYIRIKPPTNKKWASLSIVCFTIHIFFNQDVIFFHFVFHFFMRLFVWNGAVLIVSFC